MDKAAKIYVAGHRGLVGSAIIRKLEAEGYCNLVIRTSSELDLRNQLAVADFFQSEKPEYVFLAAAKVGGIVANNTYPAEFIYDNLMIQTNIIHQAYLHKIKRLLFLGSTCIYPRLAPQPLKEEYLLTGPLEPTNEPYAIAKIAGIKMCQSYNRQYGTKFICAMPTNLYGPNDNFDLETSHVLPALMRKFHEAKARSTNRRSRSEVSPVTAQSSPEECDAVVIWGTGSPLREFLHAEDLADGSVFLLNLPDEIFSSLITDPSTPALINLGSGEEISIKDLAHTIKEVVGFNGEVVFDNKKPDGTQRKVSDLSRIRALGWQHKVSLTEGLRDTYRWYLENCKTFS